jgi:hypothetical protein
MIFTESNTVEQMILDAGALAPARQRPWCTGARDYRDEQLRLRVTLCMHRSQ